MKGGSIPSGERNDQACVSQINGTCFSYDGLGRLTGMTQDLASTANDVTWTFSGRNPAGQITSWGASSTVYDYEEIASSTINKTYDGLNRDAGIASIAGYDLNGNLAKEGSTSDKRCMTFDSRIDCCRWRNVIRRRSRSSP